MIAYFDTSAVVPLLVDDEPGAEICRQAWSLADAVVTSRLMYVEAVTALARAERMDRLTEEAHDRAVLGLDAIWSQFDVVEIGEASVHRAAGLARQHRLRGYDAVHCAAALSIAGPETVAVGSDRHLIAAWRAEGLDVIDTLA